MAPASLRYGPPNGFAVASGSTTSASGPYSSTRRTSRGREEGYSDLLRRYQGPVFSLAYRIVREREPAEDLTQETFVEAFAALDTYRPEGKLSSWLFKIANNLSVDYLRQRQLETQALEESSADDTAGTAWATAIQPASPSGATPAKVDPREFQGALEQAIRQLSGKCRRCVTLRLFEERPYDSIGEILDLPVGTVKVYLHRARPPPTPRKCCRAFL